MKGQVTTNTYKANPLVVGMVDLLGARFGFVYTGVRHFNADLLRMIENEFD